MLQECLRGLIPKPLSPLCRAWLRIKEALGCTSNWPHWMSGLMWSSELKRSDRFKIAGFAYTNGLPSDYLHDVFAARSICHMRIAEMTSLYKYWDHPDMGEVRRSQFYSFKISARKVLALNGVTKVAEENRGYGAP